MALPDLKRQTIQDLPKAQKNHTVTSLDWWIAERGPLLEEWGTRIREEQLRRIYRHDYNWMVQGAFAGIMKLIASTPWEIDGPDTGEFNIDYWQNVIRNADFGRGWGSFVQKGVDYLRQDGGWFWEIIAPGSPTKEPDGPATGIAYLDSLRCLPTGDPEFPVIYMDAKGKLHKMHHTRIVQLVDMPDGDERRPGYGLCALSRAVSIANREVLMGRYTEAMLDDEPAPGIVIAAGLMEQERQKAVGRYQEEQGADQKPMWGKQLWLFAPDPALAPKIETTAFQQPPEKFDFKTYTELDVDALALAIGVDRQDLWQLTGGNLGSGTQSEILNQKSRGKTIGYLRTSIERALNDILPEEYEFSFKYRDAQEDQERAQVAQIWSGAVSSAQMALSMDEQRRILADTVEQFGEVLRDENGEVRERDDLDVLAEGQGNNDVTRDEVENDGPATNGARPTQNGRARPNPQPHMGRRQHTDSVHDAEKQFQATRLNFEIEWADLIEAAKAKDLTRQRFRVVARALLRRHGLDAFRDGLKEGGVETEALDDEDTVEFATWLAQQSNYVSNIESRLYVAERNENAEASADMWANKSLQEIYYAGINSANRNGMFEFAGEDGLESCGTCKRLKGQRHRMKDWTRKKMRPGVDTDNFECKGFFCNHVLTLTDQPAYGRF